MERGEDYYPEEGEEEDFAALVFCDGGYDDMGSPDASHAAAEKQAEFDLQRLVGL